MRFMNESKSFTKDYAVQPLHQGEITFLNKKTNRLQSCLTVSLKDAKKAQTELLKAATTKGPENPIQGRQRPINEGRGLLP